jgi:pepF/M3 family oligoendopeptidase
MSRRIRNSATLTAPRAESAELPRWDLTVLYPGLDSPEFAAGFARLLEQIEDLAALFAEAGVRGEPGEEATLDDALVAAFERVLGALNAVDRAMDEIGAYLYGHVTTNSRDELAQARFSELQECRVDLTKLQTRFNAWVGVLPVEELIARSALAAAHAFPLRHLHAAARYLMSEAEEDLAAELAPSAGVAWDKLHGNLSSQITAPVEVEGDRRALPMSEIRNLAMHPDRALRWRAWEAELSAWEANALPLAAALNGVKGQTLTLATRRGWDDPLAEALFWSTIDHEILDALTAEARASLPDFRRYLAAKARALGLEQLAWYDLFAPVGDAGRAWSWAEATAFIEDRFAAYNGRLAGLARRAFAERWIDAGPRPGKAGGAYCMALIGEQSRILANYAPSYEGVSTLAHELGHAYHNLNEAELTPLQKRTPMILAETASTFCETIVREAALAAAGPGERLYILEQSLQGACQVVVDILSRFDFERAVFAARAERELSVRELNRLMLTAQDGTYGDAIDPEARHPFMWAVKGHYYDPDGPFYNFPYLFGLLFGLGLYAAGERDPDGFAERYDALLGATGLASASDLAARFGIDLRSRAFWRESLDVVRGDIERFEELVGNA